MRWFLLGCCALLSAAAVTGCRSEPAAVQAAVENSPSATHAPAQDSAPEPKGRLSTPTASKAKDQLAQRLTARLVEAMTDEGPAAAIRVCSQEANAIAAEVSEELGVRIGRTSHRLRNAKNEPPDWAVEFIKADAAAEQHAMLLDDGTTAALYPIKLQPQCVMCHGQPDELNPEVRNVLNDLYPEDQATGFAEGDLRGWFWVEVPAKR